MTAPYALRAGGTVNRALRIYLAALFGLWSIAFLVVGVRRFVLHRGYPFNTFLFAPVVRFTDFTIHSPRFAFWGQGDRFFSNPGFPFTYPAPLLVSELAYYKMTSAPLYAYLATVILFAIAAGLLLAMAIPKQRRVRLLAVTAAIATTIFSFPLFFLIDRANIEGLVWIATSLGLFLFARHRYSLSGLFLALATAMKVFPGVFLLLLLAKRRYRDLCLALASFVAIALGSLWVAGPSTAAAAQGIGKGMDFFRKDQVLHYKPFEVGFDHSLFALIKQIGFRVYKDVDRLNAILPGIYLIYAVSAVLLFVALYTMRIRRLPVLNQILALSSLSILLPFVSYDYTLVHMFAPFGFLILVLATDGGSGRLTLTLTQMSLLLIPFAFVFTPQTYLVTSVVGFDGPIKASALAALVAASLWIPLPSSLFNELPERQQLLLNLELNLHAPEREYA